MIAYREIYTRDLRETKHVQQNFLPFRFDSEGFFRFFGIFGQKYTQNIQSANENERGRNCEMETTKEAEPKL